MQCTKILSHTIDPRLVTTMSANRHLLSMVDSIKDFADPSSLDPSDCCDLSSCTCCFSGQFLTKLCTCGVCFCCIGGFFVLCGPKLLKWAGSEGADICTQCCEQIGSCFESAFKEIRRRVASDDEFAQGGTSRASGYAPVESSGFSVGQAEPSTLSHAPVPFKFACSDADTAWQEAQRRASNHGDEMCAPVLHVMDDGKPGGLHAHGEAR